MAADAIMPVSVVVERRAANSQWVDHVWRPIGVLPIAANDHGKLLAEGEGWAHFHGGTLDIELFRGETEGYLTNLSQAPAVVYVVLRKNEEFGALEYQPFLATVCPYEAMGYSDGNDDVVEAVPMPPEVMAWVQDFVQRHHVDTPFIKRKNRRHEDDYGGKAPAIRRGGTS
ncbi:MAG TPA: DUF3305 domain-containing protein [Pseudolabrys sp.]|jgi:hypothetical protein|nr:DUF3305 domain-containing protein [Pseudolabrys sp.]